MCAAVWLFISFEHLKVRDKNQYWKTLVRISAGLHAAECFFLSDPAVSCSILAAEKGENLIRNHPENSKRFRLNGFKSSEIDIVPPY